MLLNKSFIGRLKTKGFYVFEIYGSEALLSMIFIVR